MNLRVPRIVECPHVTPFFVCIYLVTIFLWATFQTIDMSVSSLPPSFVYLSPPVTSMTNSFRGKHPSSCHTKLSCERAFYSVEPSGGVYPTVKSLVTGDQRSEHFIRHPFRHPTNVNMKYPVTSVVLLRSYICFVTIKTP